MIKLYNTMGRKVEEFKSLKSSEATIYTCGPTVYDYQHIGNYSGYIYWDVLVRVLGHYNYKVNRVMNITDVGHLVSDEDEGEDKLESGAKREGKTAREVADYFAADFIESMEALNLLKPKYANATDHIADQQAMIQTLLDGGFAYQTDQAIYFDVTKLDDYGKLTGQKLSDKEVGVRPEVVTDPAKKTPQDFALWFFTVGRFATHEMHWSSPWGDGFPGWHIECSAIIHKLLGDPIDIHAGGVDHIGTHHTNEIAQTEAAYKHPLATYWIHNNHMMVDGRKISKSARNGFTLKDLEAQGYTPMDFKLLVLQGHYRNQSNFSWDSQEAAKNRLKDLRMFSDLLWSLPQTSSTPDTNSQAIKDSLLKHLGNDLDTPSVLARLNEVSDQYLDILATYNKDSFKDLLEFIDNLLGLDLANTVNIDDAHYKLISEREAARKSGDFQKSDSLRDQLARQGIGLRDTPQGSVWYHL